MTLAAPENCDKRAATNPIAQQVCFMEKKIVFYWMYVLKVTLLYQSSLLRMFVFSADTDSVGIWKDISSAGANVDPAGCANLHYKVTGQGLAVYLCGASVWLWLVWSFCPCVPWFIGISAAQTGWARRQIALDVLHTRLLEARWEFLKYEWTKCHSVLICHHNMLQRSCFWCFPVFWVPCI